jgi:hypothetical protein
MFIVATITTSIWLHCAGMGQSKVAYHMELPTLSQLKLVLPSLVNSLYTTSTFKVYKNP